MSDQSGLRYLFRQPNLKSKQTRWLAMISEFDFEIRNIEGKENRVSYALKRWIQVNHIEDMSSYWIDLHDRILHASQKDDMYMELMYILQQGVGGQDVKYHLTIDGLIRFRERIYLLDNSELKKTIL